jgi:hypothetical protein
MLAELRRVESSARAAGRMIYCGPSILAWSTARSS